ncbi:MAG TPA: hypothetical protein VFZ26_18870 [Gemmatimonadales bacterium]
MPALTRLGGFAVLYMTAILLELVERWRHPYAATAALALVLALLAFGVTRITFLVFLASTTAYFLLAQFPDVANHVNIEIYCNLLLMAAIGWSLVRRRDYPEDDDVYEMVRPALQASMLLVYGLAGFAKLNADFLNPEVSCVGTMVGDLARVATLERAGIPTGLLLLLPLLYLAYRLLAPRLSRAPLVAGLAAVAATWLVALLVWPGLDSPAASGFLVGMAVAVILWELVLGPMLAIPALQLPVLVVSWGMHAALALIGFVDFGALALALLLTFVPRGYADLVNAPMRLPLVGRPMPRVQVYFAICVVAGVCSALGRRFPAGLAFNLAALVLLWPIIEAAAARGAAPWRGVPISSPLTPRWLFAFPLLLLLHGLTSYLGLRTAGNFTMFSNLRTEGARSNHLVLPGNPLKLWGYDEDAVRVLEIDDARAAIGHQYQPLRGHRLPVVEFRKLIRAWSRAGATVPVRFEYAGTTWATDDIARDPVWGRAHRDWKMRLLDFRVIQDDGPNRCRW